MSKNFVGVGTKLNEDRTQSEFPVCVFGRGDCAGFLQSPKPDKDFLTLDIRNLKLIRH